MARPRKPGDTYANRADLQAVPTGRGYGERQKFEQQMGTPAARAATAGPIAAPRPAGGDLAAALASFTGGSAVGLAAPTARPGEPPTAGLPIGPGGGPETAPGLIRRQGPNPDVTIWRRYMPMFEMMAARADSSSELRQMVRRIRSQMPVDPYSQPRPQ